MWFIRWLKPSIQDKIAVQILFMLFQARNMMLQAEMLMKKGMVAIIDLIGLILLGGRIMRQAHSVLLVRGK